MNYEQIFAQAVAAGFIIGMLIVPLGIVVLQAQDLRQRLKPEGSRRRGAYAVVRWLPKHIYHNTDWKTAGKATVTLGWVAAFLAALVALLAIGFIETFLS